MLALGVTLAAVLPQTAAAAAAPDPGGNERANVRLPAQGSFLGLNENLGWTMSAAEMARAVRETGGSVLRTVVSWHHLEPQQGVWNEKAWNRLSQYNRALRQRGVRMLAILGFAPPWARDRGFAGSAIPPSACPVAAACAFPPRAGLDHTWRRYVREAAKRLPGAMFQTWNEPNWEGFWRTGPDPERWAELHTAAWQEIRSVRRKAKVIACGCLASGYGHPGTIPVREFLTRAYRHEPSIRGRYHALGLNVSPQGGRGAGRRFGARTWFAQAFADLRRAARAGGARRPRIVVTELGLWTSDGPAALSEHERARSIVRVVRRLATMPRVAGVILHRLRARTEDSPRERAMSLLRVPGGAPTPAWCWLTNMAGNYGARGCATGRRPRAVVLSGPPRRTRSSSALIRLATQPASARLECSLDGRAYRRCGRQVRLKRLRPGRHQLRVRAWNESGVQQPRPARHSWRVTRR